MLSNARINAYTDEKFAPALKLVHRKEQTLEGKRTVTECGIPRIASDGILDQSHFFPDLYNVYLEGASA